MLSPITSMSTSSVDAHLASKCVPHSSGLNFQNRKSIALSSATNRHPFAVYSDFKYRSFQPSPPHHLVSEILVRERGRTVYQIKNNLECKIMNLAYTLLCKGTLANVRNTCERNVMFSSKIK
jgi:hypothetical protein